MAKTHFKGTEIHTNGDLPSVGSVAPDFILIKNDLSNLKLSDLKGKRVVLNIFPSVDTGVCAASVRRFNKDAANLNNSVILCISKDLPFAQGRFCGAEGIDNVIMLSDFQNNDFVNAYGILLTDGPLKGLHARSVVVIDENGKVTYNQLVNDIVEEPDYEAALKALK
ncbi:peroxidase [Porphyromonadaceae bacterium COT-184 OH4590]|nr:peroxidase [Porphyromonadaceae bacterium COT-184 OH4590]MDO4726085.1 thiol peroxidase [Porphyromonadaceae bacterium]